MRTALALLLLLVGPLFSGCFDPAGPDAGDGDDGGDGMDGGDGGDGDAWVNPYDFTLYFDGGAAYDTALRQLYDDPEAKEGPRHRIPGTDTHAAVAAELLGLLDDPMRDLGGRASMHRFDGERYYGLDLTPVSQYLCPADDPARDRVRDLEFVNIVGRTSNSEIGLVIGAHWDSKRHADARRDPAHAGEPILAADDGAASVAAVIELARAFATEDPGIPLTFALFDGEDGFEQADCHPLAGSLHYAQSLSATERATMQGMILLDMIGNASATFYHEGNSRSYQAPDGTVRSAWLGDLVWSTAEAMSVAAFVERNTNAIADDHVPFLHEGHYAIDIIRYENGFAPYWHTTRDDETAIQPAGIAQVGVVVEASIRRYATDPDAFRP